MVFPQSSTFCAGGSRWTFRARACLFLLLSWSTLHAGDSWNTPHQANPVIPGYYADPSLVRYQGTWYLYATIDPWGGETLGCWRSDDFKNWIFCPLNWPTKKACTGPTSNGSMVWAPSVVRSPDGRFHMFVSVGSEVWTGVADSPLGPWQNALGDKLLIPATWNRTYHMIDAEAFIDDDGTTYLYWGSGWNWVNGHCFVVTLTPDLKGFANEPQDVTTPHYFEGPFMFKQNGRYYLSYSNGRTDQDNYEVHYAIGKSPLGPFVEPSAAPIIATDKERNIVSPGHHAFFRYEGEPYILYHRQSLPFVLGSPVRRQVCVDPLQFESDGTIANVAASHSAPPFARGRRAIDPALAKVIRVSASSVETPERTAEAAFDDNYATRWAPRADDAAPWLQIDFGSAYTVKHSELRPEYAWKDYAFVVEASSDGQDWVLVEDRLASHATGSPIVLRAPTTGRYLRIRFTPIKEAPPPSLFEWVVEAVPVQGSSEIPLANATK